MILVTGASGFIGKHLINRLSNILGPDRILALSSKSVTNCRYLNSLQFTFDVHYFIEHEYVDIDTIIHLGAFTPKSGNDSNSYMECNSNIINTQNLLRCEMPNLKKFIFISTLDVYSNEGSKISENSSTDPISLYGHSKLYCERMIEAWANDKNIIFQVLRLGHVYGPGEELYQKIIPTSMKTLLENKNLKQYGEGQDQRSFIFIDDVVTSIINSLELPSFVGPINIVGSQNISINKLLNKMVLISGRDVQIEKVAWDGGRRDLIFDNSKLKKFLLSKETSLDEGLQKEWNYFLSL